MDPRNSSRVEAADNFKYVGIKSPLLSLLYKGGLVAVLLYVLVGLVLFGKGYLSYETPIGMVRFRLEKMQYAK